MTDHEEQVEEAERLPRGAENLLRAWPLVERAEGAWEGLAAKVETRLRTTRIGSTDASVLCAPLPTEFEERAATRPQAPAEARALPTGTARGDLAALTQGGAATEPARPTEERQSKGRGDLVAVGDTLSQPDGADDADDFDLDAVAANFPGHARTPPAPPPPLVQLEMSRGRPMPNLTPWLGGALIGIAATAAFFVGFHPLGPGQPAFVVVPAQPTARNAKAENDSVRDTQAAKVEPTIIPATALETEEAFEPSADGKPLALEDPQLRRSITPGQSGRIAGTNPGGEPVSMHSTADAVVLEEDAAKGPETATREEAKATAGNTPKVPGLRPAAGTGERAPDRPSVGAAGAAIGAVLSGARSCVAGQEASRATVVFRSDGTVERVLVTGPAVGTPAEGCIQAALAGARVEPFARPTFSVAATVRSH